MTATPGPSATLTLLHALADELATGGLETTVLAGNDVSPDQLVLLVEETLAPTALHVCFLPGLREPAALQYFALLDADLVPGAESTTARVLQLVNTTIPVTGFELSESTGSVAFRHTHAVSLDPLEVGVVAWTMAMIVHAVRTFEPTVVQACRGVGIDELAAALDRLQDEITDG